MKKKLNSGDREARIYQDEVEAYNHYGKECPKCGAMGELVAHGKYQRHLVSYDGVVVCDTLVTVKRFKCKSCGSTHGLLPDILIPYGVYSLRFKLYVLLVYFERSVTVAAICETFGIVASLLYAWVKQFEEHKELLQGVLKSQTTTAVVFIREYLPVGYGVLQHFFTHFGFSFLQSRRKTAQTVPHRASG